MALFANSAFERGTMIPSCIGRAGTLRHQPLKCRHEDAAFGKHEVEPEVCSKQWHEVGMLAATAASRRPVATL